jgi:serine phosphatase RsbU (regulator of sigma subunit)
MGHGPQAARTAADVLGAFRDLAGRPMSLRSLTMRLHTLVADRDRGEEFVTALIMTFPRDPQAGRYASDAELVCCGHPPPLLLRGTAATFIDGIPSAPPLGLLDLAGCQASTVMLPVRPGDSLLLYSDGITEARDARGRPYPLAQRAAELRRASPGRWLDALQTDLVHHAGGVLKDDAAALLLLRSDHEDSTALPRAAFRGGGTTDRYDK